MSWLSIYTEISKHADVTEDDQEHEKRIVEMPPRYPMPEYVKQWCADLTEMSKKLKNWIYEN